MLGRDMIAWIAGKIAGQVIPGYVKYAAIALAASLAYWFVWDTGRGFERGRWERATQVELRRQADATEDARVASEVAAGRLLASEAERQKLLRRLRDEALADDNAGNACIGAAGVMRLNSIGG